MKTTLLAILLLSACAETDATAPDAAPATAEARINNGGSGSTTTCTRRWVHSGDTWCMLEDCCTVVTFPPSVTCTSNIVDGSCSRFVK